MEDSGNQQNLGVLLPKANVITLTYKNSEIDDVKAILQKIQEKHGIVAPTMKDLFHEILKITLNSLENPNSNSDISTEQIQEIQSKFGELNGHCTDLMNQVNEKDQEINRLQTLVDQFEQIDFEVKEINLPFNPATGDIHIKLTETQEKIIDTIATNRHSKGYDLEKKSNSEIGEMLIFNKGTLFNWAGEVYTGL